jgi:hypothetical protein
MMPSFDQAFAAVRALLDGGGFSFPLYYHGDDPPILPDTPAPFAFVVFNNEGSTIAGYGGGRGQNLYRNRARVEAYVFSPFGYGAEAASSLAEPVAAQLRSHRDDVISCFESDVVFSGPGSALSVPGLSTEVNNYAAAIVECNLFFDQTG